jgi:hypothetical protein
MNDAYTDAIKEAFALAPANVVTYHTLQIRQIGVQASIFLVQSRRSIIAADENGDYHTFEPVGFQFSLPASNAEGFTSLNIVIDNIGRRVTQFIESATSAVQVVEVLYRPYLSTDLSQPQMSAPILLFLKDVEVNDLQVTGRATFMDLVNKKFPLELYNRETFPALG